ncbi:ATP-binding protein [uncultured Ruminococcus sp.]|uniref:ATP-binding protein n=1 Tax=uncultured Ruminococcus sp. TaxID=165186 RepID=UPI0025D1A265|nr:ATP-binding protein [uncultured Ruminococcus sp.]
MFRKVHDRMFNRAQMKLFGMIVSILLAVFLALIIGINVITEEVMSSESKEVLQEIAQSLGYNEKEEKFYLDTRGQVNDGRNNNPPPKPFDDKNVTSSAGSTAASSETAPSSTEQTAENTDASTEGEADNSGEPSENAAPENDTQSDEQKPEDYTWFAIPTLPEGATFPTMANGGSQSWGGQGGGQSWGGWSDWNSQNGGQDWSQWGGQGGSQDWSQWGGQGSSQDWSQWGGQGGSQDWGQWGGQGSSQDWSQWGGQGSSQDWSQWNNDDWNINGWKIVDGKWQNDNGETWDGQGTPPWIETKAEGKNEDWWSSYNPYTWWIPNNPMNPMNPDNQYAKKYNENKKSDSDKKESDAEKKASDDTDDTEVYAESSSSEAELSKTAYQDDGYEIVQLAYTDNYSQPAKTGTPAANNKNNVEPIPKTIGSINYFAIMADTNGKYLDTFNNDEIVDERAQRYTSAIINYRKDTGMINSYQYYKASKPNGTIMILTDKSSEKEMLNQLKRTTMIVGAIALLVLSVLAYFLSKKSIQPIREAFDKQKQFVSDASHELKTPLTVISTNADVLEGEIGDNKWLNYIKSQTDRMSVLVNDLLNLTRLENSNNELERRYFNLSKAIANTALPFECQAFESNKKFEVNIEDNIMLNGSEKHIKQMAAIFIDNALKYSNDGGTIQVTLKRSGERKLFSVYNTGQGIKETDTEKIFERFYRSDESRNRATGGYGLGLAIAKSVADKHKFKIHVLNQPGKSVCFIVTM